MTLERLQKELKASEEYGDFLLDCANEITVSDYNFYYEYEEALKEANDKRIDNDQYCRDLKNRIECLQGVSQNDRLYTILF